MHLKISTAKWRLSVQLFSDDTRQSRHVMCIFFCSHHFVQSRRKQNEISIEFELSCKNFREKDPWLGNPTASGECGNEAGEISRPWWDREWQHIQLGLMERMNSILDESQGRYT